MAIYNTITADIIIGELVEWEFDRVVITQYNKDTGNPYQSYFETIIPRFKTDKVIIPGHKFRLPNEKRRMDYYKQEEAWQEVDENNIPIPYKGGYWSDDLMFHTMRYSSVIYGYKVWMRDKSLSLDKLLEYFNKYETMTGRKAELFRVDYEKDKERYFATMD